MTTRPLRSLCWAFTLLALLGVIRPAPAQVQLAASTGDVTWAGRTRAASGNLVSMLMRVYVPPSATSGTLTIGVGATGGVRHKFTVGADLALGVASGNTVGGTRTATYSTTNTEGRWIWYAVLIPANYIGGGAVNPSLWYDANGTWSTAAGASSGSDPTGTIGDTAGTVQITNGTNAAVVVGPVYLWAGADSPDTLAEMRSVALGSTAPETFTGLVFRSTLAGVYADTVGSAAGAPTGGALVDLSGLPSWFGVRHHALHRYNFVGSSGTITSKTNGALTGGNLVVPAGFTGARGGTWPDGRSGVRVGNGQPDTGFVNMALEADTADTGRPLVHSQYCTIVIVGRADVCNRTNAFTPVATNAGADVMRTRIHGLLRPSVRSGGGGDVATDLRVPASSSVLVWRCNGSSVDYFINGRKSAVSSSVLASGTGTNLRIGCLTTAASELADMVIQDVITIEGDVVDADIAELTQSLAIYHRAVIYPTEVWVIDGASSAAGAHDLATIGGLEARMSKWRPKAVIYSRGIGGFDLTTALTDYSAMGDTIATSLHPGLRKSALLWYDSNGIESGDTLISIQTEYTTLVGNYRASGYTNIVAVEVHPRNFTGDASGKHTIRRALNAWLVTSGLFNKVIPITALPFLNDDGDHADTTYYASDATHLNQAGWSGIESMLHWAIPSNSTGRSNRVSRSGR